jgi:hypothetical protein
VKTHTLERADALRSKCSAPGFLDTRAAS